MTLCMLDIVSKVSNKISVRIYVKNKCYRITTEFSDLRTTMI